MLVGLVVSLNGLREPIGESACAGRIELSLLTPSEAPPTGESPLPPPGEPNRSSTPAGGSERTVTAVGGQAASSAR